MRLNGERNKETWKYEKNTVVSADRGEYVDFGATGPYNGGWRFHCPKP